MHILQKKEIPARLVNGIDTVIKNDSPHIIFVGAADNR
jgi:hypothetical protein